MQVLPHQDKQPNVSLTPFQHYLLDQVRRHGQVPRWFGEDSDWQAIGDELTEEVIIQTSPFSSRPASAIVYMVLRRKD